jgi:glycosyltransferase involved in cell wall biosynthesis
VRRAPSILAAIRLAPDIRRAVATAALAGAGSAMNGSLRALLDAVDDLGDTVTATAAVHALGVLPGRAAEEALRSIIEPSAHGHDAHAAWSLTRRQPAPVLFAPLARTVARGGLAGMHAQVALGRWAREAPRLTPAILDVLWATLLDTGADSGRRYLVETVGLVPGPAALRLLERVATDTRERDAVRIEAILALGDRPSGVLPEPVARLTGAGGPLATAVGRARVLQALAHRARHRDLERSDRLTIAQVHLGAVLDADATRAGMGDAGGVATLLSRLGSELARQEVIGRVISIGREASDAHADPAAARLDTGHRFEGVRLEEGEGAAFSGAWPSLVAARRGIRAVFLGSGRPDVVHLRMADPGSLAAMLVARDLGIPTAFTVAPDPHAPMAAAEQRGTLDRRTFAGRDAHEALWYRVSLVSRLAQASRQLVLFPRPDLERDLRELVGLDLADTSRHTTVAEGIDLRVTERASRTVRRREEASVLRDLRLAIARLPIERQGLPVVVSVGRLQAVKGMARVVEAFAVDSDLARRANLVIVGGDLEQPAGAEAAELGRIHAILEDDPSVRQRVVLLGHRAHAETALVLAAARDGWGRGVASGGVYVCGSLKEEFGLAIVEALAAGLPVVAPRLGGPATYVEPGRTGVLVDTTDASEIAGGIRQALELAKDERTASYCRELVRSRFTLERMARSLALVYRRAADDGSAALPVGAGRAA